MSKSSPFPYKSIMQGLYLPAVIGTAFVAILTRVTLHSSATSAFTDLALYFALFFVIYFSTSYWINDELSAAKYGPIAFMADLFEVVLSFVVFNALGLFEPGKIVEPSYRVVFIAFIGVLGTQTVWSIATRQWDPRLTSLVLAVELVLAGAVVWGYQQAWVHLLTLVVLYAALVAYIAFTWRRRDA